MAEEVEAVKSENFLLKAIAKLDKELLWPQYRGNTALREKRHGFAVALLKHYGIDKR